MIVVTRFLNFTLIACVLFVTQPLLGADTIFDKRFERWKEQAENGDKRSQYKLGVAYLRGNGVKVNIDEAISWFTKSAKQGYVKAAHKLGFIYYTNKDKRRNYKRGFSWFLKAAKKRYAPSQFYLGQMYYEGKGVKRDLERALVWATRAEQQQYIKAKQLIADIHDAMKRVAVTPPPPPKRSQPRPSKEKTQNTNVTVTLESGGHSSAHPVPKKAVVPNNILNKPLLNVRKIVTSGNWILNGKPAEHMPSILTKCESIGNEVKCRTDRLKSETVAYSAHYEVESVFYDFKAAGTFNAKYRLNYLFVLPEDPDDPEPDEDLPALGLTTYTKLRCKVIADDKMHCFTDDFKVERFTK